MHTLIKLIAVTAAAAAAIATAAPAPPAPATISTATAAPKTSGTDCPPGSARDPQAVAKLEAEASWNGDAATKASLLAAIPCVPIDKSMLTGGESGSASLKAGLQPPGIRPTAVQPPVSKPVDLQPPGSKPK